MSAAEVTWNGAESLRDHLVPIAELEPFPGNPRRGDTTAVAASLRRFGQLKAVVVDGRRIVAGHTLVRAAEREGWTHVAFAENTFADEGEQRAFLLADNRSADLGSYDDRLLRDQLRELDEFEGTGYVHVDFVALEEKLREEAPPSEFPALDPDGLATEHRCPHCGYEFGLAGAGEITCRCQRRLQFVETAPAPQE